MFKLLTSLKISKSPGPDGINPKILKESARELAYPFKLLFDVSMKSGKIPSKWKIAEVRPIFKKGSKTTPGNYRPVSLTSIVCKLFETFLRDALCSHLLTNKLLSPHQFGFCKGRSCTTQLLVTINDWLFYLDQNIPVDAIYLDFRKAFDTVPLKRLLSKLHGYGIRNNVLKWIEDFLSNRTQYVSINQKESDPTEVSSGVPQGSVLGPSLFIYFINDLPSVIKSLAKIFADDTKAFSKISSDEDRHNLQLSLDACAVWSDTWLLRFNGSKCKVLHLGYNNPNYDYYMRDGDIVSKLDDTVCEKDLGVFIDNKLDFKEHIIKQTNKARSMAGCIHRNIINKTTDIMVPLFKAMVRPILEYGNSVWVPYFLKDSKRIEDIQRQFTKRIYGMANKSYSERLEILNLPSLEFRRLRGDMIEVFKIIHKIYDPSTTNSLLTMHPNTCGTRKKNDLNLKKKGSNGNKYNMFFTNRVNNIWNDLPNEVVNADNVNDFKNKFDKHFIRNKYLFEMDYYCPNRRK